MQGRSLALGNELRVGLDSGDHLGAGELLDLLRGTADEGAGVQESVQLGDDGVEEGGATDALDQIVVLALLLDVVGGLVGENTWVHQFWFRQDIGQKGTYGSLRGRPGGTDPWRHRP